MVPHGGGLSRANVYVVGPICGEVALIGAAHDSEEPFLTCNEEQQRGIRTHDDTAPRVLCGTVWCCVVLCGTEWCCVCVAVCGTCGMCTFEADRAGTRVHELIYTPACAPRVSDHPVVRSRVGAYAARVAQSGQDRPSPIYCVRFVPSKTGQAVHRYSTCRVGAHVARVRSAAMVEG